MQASSGYNSGRPPLPSGGRASHIIRMDLTNDKYAPQSLNFSAAAGQKYLLLEAKYLCPGNMYVPQPQGDNLMHRAMTDVLRSPAVVTNSSIVIGTRLSGRS